MPQNLNWNQRFALIEHFKLNDKEVCNLFGVTGPELDTARKLRKESGLFEPDKTMDFKHYELLIKSKRKQTITAPEEKKTVVITKETITKPKPAEPPKPKVKEENSGKKRGRKTHKIKDAYEAIPREPVPVDEFMLDYNVSLSVLRRHKNFDHIPETGQVNVRKIFLQDCDEQKTLCIWREERRGGT